MSLDHLRVDGAMIRRFGPDAALLHALIEFRQKRRTGHLWRASFTDITGDVGLTKRRAQVARDVLTEAGFLECHRGGQNSMTWTTDPESFLRADVTVTEDADQPELRSHIAGLRADVPVSPSIREDPKDNYSPHDSVDVDEEAAPMDDEPAADVVAFDGGLFAMQPIEPEVTPEGMANECRGAWVTAYTEQHGPPDPTIKRRALGQIRAIGKDRETPEDWRALWRACREAGAAGRYAISDYLGPAPVRREGTRNPWLRGLEDDAKAGRIDHLLPAQGRDVAGLLAYQNEHPRSIG